MIHSSLSVFDEGGLSWWIKEAGAHFNRPLDSKLA
jgi:hypothetical protein